MGASLSATDQQSLIIGLTIGLIALAVIIVIVVICCCCRKVERSWLKRKFKKENKKYEQQRNDLTVEQARRREALDSRHEEIRNKYGIPSSKSANSTNPFEQSTPKTTYAIENEEVNVSIR